MAVASSADAFLRAYIAYLLFIFIIVLRSGVAYSIYFGTQINRV
jgi:hypothetical protein